MKKTRSKKSRDTVPLNVDILKGPWKGHRLVYDKIFFCLNENFKPLNTKNLSYSPSPGKTDGMEIFLRLAGALFYEIIRQMVRNPSS